VISSGNNFNDILGNQLAKKFRFLCPSLNFRKLIALRFPIGRPRGALTSITLSFHDTALQPHFLGGATDSKSLNWYRHNQTTKQQYHMQLNTPR